MPAHSRWNPVCSTRTQLPAASGARCLQQGGSLWDSVGMGGLWAPCQPHLVHVLCTAAPNWGCTRSPWQACSPRKGAEQALLQGTSRTAFSTHLVEVWMPLGTNTGAMMGVSLLGARGWGPLSAQT